MSSTIKVNRDVPIIMQSRNFDAINALIMQRLDDAPNNLRAIYADYDDKYTNYLDLSDLDAESWEALSNILTNSVQELLTDGVKSEEGFDDHYPLFSITLLRGRVDTDPRIRDNLQYNELVLSAGQRWKAEKPYYEFVLLNLFAKTQHKSLRQFLAQMMFQEEVRIDVSNLKKETQCELVAVVKQVHQRYENGIPGHFPDFFTSELLVFLADLKYIMGNFEKQLSCTQ